MQIRKKLYIFLPICILILFLTLFFCIFAGSTHVPFGNTLLILLNSLGFDLSSASEITRTQEIIILNIRLPRILLAALVGGGSFYRGSRPSGDFQKPQGRAGRVGMVRWGGRLPPSL